MQQYLPFTVLKQDLVVSVTVGFVCLVATVLTVYGIETEADGDDKKEEELQQYLPFTVLKH